MKEENSAEGYTKEPWMLQGHMIFRQDCRVLGVMESLIVEEGDKSINRLRYANARRAVACVNACAGIPTEELEKGAEK